MDFTGWVNLIELFIGLIWGDLKEKGRSNDMTNLMHLMN